MIICIIFNFKWLYPYETETTKSSNYTHLPTTRQEIVHETLWRNSSIYSSKIYEGAVKVCVPDLSGQLLLCHISFLIWYSFSRVQRIYCDIKNSAVKSVPLCLCRNCHITNHNMYRYILCRLILNNSNIQHNWGCSVRIVFVLFHSFNAIHKIQYTKQGGP